MFCSRCGEQVDTSTRFCPRCGQDLTALTGAGKAGATTPIAAQPPQEDETDIIREALKDEYELEKELGRGGMAVVFKARDKQLDREVAIKVLPFSLSFDAEFVERFQREARTAGKLEHPNIIPIYRVGKSGRVIFFVMKFIRGKSLSGVIERGAMPVADIKRLLTESGGALGYAHKHGIVHRDIKPDNIMFDELGQAIVADFGIAKAQSGAKLTGTGMSIGTPHYMSPEQARAQNLDGRSDLYSLGVVAYQCLTGHVPFDGEDSFSIGYKHIMEELPTPTLDTPEQREMFAIVQKMMAKKPDDRYQTAEEMIRAIEGVRTSTMDMSTMPTRAMEPLKKDAPKPGAPPAMPPAMASQATTPLPRASASMGKPKEAEKPAPKPAAAERSSEPAARPSFKPKEVTKKKSKAPLAIAAALVLVGGGLGAYLLLNKPVPQPVAVNPPPAPVPAPVDSTPAAAAPDTAKHDTAKAPVSAPPVAAPSRTPATSRTPTAVANNPRPTTPTPTPTTTPPAGQGTISLTGVPNGARVTVDQQPKTSGRFKVPAGSHVVEVALQGFNTYRTTVNVAPGQTQTVPVTMAAATAAVPTPTPTTTAPAGGLNPACASPTGNLMPRNRCWDTRPNPRTPLQLTPPATCHGTVSPANILVNVSAAGEVISASMSRGSSCREFTDAAVSQVQDMTFTPATRGGAPVAAWTIVVMRPAR